MFHHVASPFETMTDYFHLPSVEAYCPFRLPKYGNPSYSCYHRDPSLKNFTEYFLDPRYLINKLIKGHFNFWSRYIKRVNTTTIVEVKHLTTIVHRLRMVKSCGKVDLARIHCVLCCCSVFSVVVLCSVLLFCVVCCSVCVCSVFCVFLSLSSLLWYHTFI